MDLYHLRLWAAVAAVVAFNFPICFAAFQLWLLPGFSDALREKDSAGNATGDMSYSRVTGMIGAVIVASLFWVVSNIIVVLAILSPRDVGTILSSIGTIFLVGAALFLPYAFNQLKTILQ